MRRNAIIMCCYVCVAAAFGGFFRWIQTLAAFEADTGLLIPGSIWTKLTALLCVAVTLGLLALVYGLRKREYYPARTCESVFRGSTPIPPYVYTLFAVIMAAGGVILFITSKFRAYQTLLRLLAFFSILSGAGFYYLMSSPYRQRERGMQCLCAAVLTLTLCFWLVLDYKLKSTIPSVWSYGIEILALAVDAIAFYYAAGYSFGRPKPYRTMFSVFLGAFLSLVTLADERMLGMQLIMGATAGMLMYMGWMTVATMREKKPMAPITEDGAANNL